MEIDLQPGLEGQWVTLRPLRIDDFDALYAVAADPEIWSSTRFGTVTARMFLGCSSARRLHRAGP